jgi:HK97 family phage prohead protease
MRKEKITLQAKVKKEGNTIPVIASNETPDRHGEVLSHQAWDLAEFKRAPRMLVDHAYETSKIVGAWRNPRVEEKQLVMEPDFHDITQLARETKQMVEEGYLDTVSVGLLLHYEEKANDKGEAEMNVRYELLEVSWVAVGANPDARIKKGMAEEVSVSDVKKIIDYLHFEEKEIEPEKGAVSDEVAAQEAFDQKIKNIGPVMDVVWAMVDIYLADKTPVEKFNELVNETADILKQLTNGEKSKDTGFMKGREKMTDELAIELMFEIYGVDIPEENAMLIDKNVVDEALSSLAQTSAVLQKLVSAPIEGGQSGVESKEKSKTDDTDDTEKSVLIDRDVMEYIQTQLRVNDKHNEASLKLVKKILGN